MQTYTVLTTFNQSGYELYGRRMIRSFLQNWPKEIELWVFAENCEIKESANNLRVFDLEQSSPELVAFKQQWRDVPKANGDVSNDPTRNKRKDAGKGFKWDAVRFSHKVFSLFAAAEQCNTDWLIWMDADTYCHSLVTLEQIRNLIPESAELCYLGRDRKYTECGLYALHLKSPKIKQFLKEFKRYYTAAESGIFTLKEWHDSYVFDAVRNLFDLSEHNWSSGLISGEGHPLINCEWGAYLDHLKGNRKNLGRSKAKDLKIDRTEPYWK